MDMETTLLSELQQVQRDIARRRQQRVQRQLALQQQLAEARLQLQREVEEDDQLQARITPTVGGGAGRLLHSQQRHLGGAGR